MGRKKIAIVSDVDHTDTRIDLPNLVFEECGLVAGEVWDELNEKQAAHKRRYPDSNVDGFYVNWIAKQSSNPKSPLYGLTVEKLEQIGQNLPPDVFFPGMPDFYKRIKEANLDHDITTVLVSLGIHHIISASELGENVDRIFAYTFRNDTELGGLEVVGSQSSLEKGCAIKKVSRGGFYGTTTEGFEYPIENMIFKGDGDTDLEAFRTVNRKNGLTICVYKEGDSRSIDKAHALKDEVQFVLPADYRKGSDIWRVTNNFIRR